MSDFTLTSAVIPASMLGKLQAYVDRGEPVGGFLAAVLCNDLKEAVFRADSVNRSVLPDYVRLMYWDMPSQAHGSREKMDAWVAKMGLLDLTEERVLANAIDAANNHTESA